MIKPLKGRVVNPYSIPSVIDPHKTRCIQVEIPDSLEHLQIFYAALLTLTKWKNWELDGTTSASQCANLWRELLIKQDFPLCGSGISGGADEGDDFMIRQNPDNPCIIETSADGIHWCLLADISLCIPSGPQPGAGAEQPGSGGGQACYQGTLFANSTWLLPTLVTTGDIIQLQNVLGAGNDGGSTSWKCATGDTFLGGICLTGTGAIGSGDPAPSVNHMRLIWNVDGIFYDAMTGPLTIPSGVSSAQVYLQVNDSGLSNNSGSYTFQACATNNQTFAGIAITYFTGSGPSGVSVGAEFDIVSASNGTSQHPDFAFSQCVKFTVISSTGFVPVTGAGVVLYAYLDCDGVFHNGPTETTSSTPTDWNTADPCTTRTAWNGANSSVFTLRLRIDAIC